MPEVSLLATSGDRRENFPDWPFWALALITVQQGGTLGNGNPAPPPTFAFKIIVADTPENRTAFEKAPVAFFIANDEIAKDDFMRAFMDRNTLVIHVPTASPWKDWLDALIIFAPAGSQETGAFGTEARAPRDNKTATQLLNELKQAEHDDARARQLARLKAFGTIGGHQVFPHINPDAATVVVPDSFPNLSPR